MTIPASAIVAVNPGVIGAGGTAISTVGLLLSSSTRVPIGAVQSFPSAAAVSAYFGAGATETTQATIYFNGYDNSTVKPSALLITQYPTAAIGVNAYLRGGNISGLTLAQLQALTGTLSVIVNGQTFTSGTINLSGAASFSAAATTIQTALAGKDAVVTGSITTTTLTVTAVSSGTLYVGQVISGSGVTVGTTITALGTGTGGTGTYTVSVSQSASSTTITAGATLVTYDSQSGAFVVTGGTPGVNGTITYATGTIAAGLLLTAATGAVTSQGAAQATPVAFMNALVATTQNFVTFKTTFEPVTADKVAFASWASAQNNRYLYVMPDTDITVTTVNNTSSAGYQIKAASYSGTAMIYEPSALGTGPFVMGAVASIDFSRQDGRLNLAFCQQAGLGVGVTSQTIAAQLLLNGYNFYGQYGTASQQFSFLYNGSVTGSFLWIDSYVNQIWLNSGLQGALMNLLVSSPSIPFNAAGAALIEAACADPISAALNFGAIRANVPLSAIQAAEVNAAAGLAIDQQLSTRGWYLQVLVPPAAVRVARGPWAVTLWYMDGQSVNSITVSSQEVQ